jgi:Homeodomain-like domain
VNKHGKPLTNEDKRWIVVRMVEDGEWGQWSDREVARHCGVSHEFVSRLRRSLSTVDSEQRRKVRTRHGTATVMQVGKIGKQSEAPPALPDEVAVQQDLVEVSRTPQSDVATLRATATASPTEEAWVGQPYRERFAHDPCALAASETVLADAEGVETLQEAAETAGRDEAAPPLPGHAPWSFDTACSEVIATLDTMAAHLDAGGDGLPEGLPAFLATTDALLARLKRVCQRPDPDVKDEPGRAQTDRERVRALLPALPDRFTLGEVARRLERPHTRLWNVLQRMMKQGEVRKGKGRGEYRKPRQARTVA